MIEFWESDGSELRWVRVVHPAMGELTVVVDGRGAAARVEWGSVCPADATPLDAASGRRFAALLTRYFDGEDVTVRVSPRGVTPLQLAVMKSVTATPRGEVTSYAEVAALAGYPRAVRAVATAVGRNVLPVIVPCHRVVPSAALRIYRQNPVALLSRPALLGHYTPSDSLKPLLLASELAAPLAAIK